jgi:type VI secretion system FHA domain protein
MGQMALRLTVTSEHSALLGEHATMVLDKSGGTIGRANDNDWVLPDPQRFVSAHHARISYRNGSYIIEDTSTNGLYLNDGADPVGRTGPQPLRPGDRLRLGPYRISVRDHDATAAEISAIVPFSAPLAPGKGAEQPAEIAADLDISALLVNDEDLSAARRAYDPWGNPVADSALLQFDQAQQSAPRAARAAPPDRPASPARAAPPARPAPAARAEPGAPVTLEAFCRGAGVDVTRLPAEGQERLLQLAGLLLREALVGIKELARTQREIRQDSGLCATADDPERVALQNLPVEDLLVRLLVGHEERALDAVQWLRELFGLASRHDAALMRALRPALIEFTQRLDPALLSPDSPAAERFRSITGMAGGRLPHLFAESLARSFNAEIGGGPKGD